MTAISVIICTHNPRPDYLSRALAALRAQTFDRARWEFLLVDNASTPPLDQRWDLSSLPRARCIREEELGLTAARLRGIAEASGDVLIFADDDNVLAPDYLERAAAIRTSHPHLEVFGSGTLVPEFEVPPGPELSPRLGMLALRTVSAPRWSNNAQDYGCIPWGAGLVITRRIARRYPEFLHRLNIEGLVDRRGGHLFSGGDDLFSWTAASEGFGFGVFPELRVQHLIAAGRLTQPYFLKLIRDHAYSNSVIKHRTSGAVVAPRDAFRIVQVLLHGARNGVFSMRCQWAASCGEAAAARFLARDRLRTTADAMRRPSAPASAPVTETVISGDA